jgi:oligoendopeptidase F
MATQFEIPERKDVPPSDTWDLSKLYPSADAWEADLKKLEKLADEFPAFQGTLGKGPESLLAALEAMKAGEMLGERLGYWANLRVSEDEGNNDSRGRMARFMMVATKASGAESFFAPEVQAIPDADIGAWLKRDDYAEYRVYLHKLLRYKPHVLSQAEERLLALQMELNQLPSDTFGVLTNVDIDFGSVETKEGPRPLSQSSVVSFLQDPDRKVREAAYKQFYRAYDTHKNALASLYAGSCRIDGYQAKVRKHPSAREQALFADDVPTSVYDNLIKTVGDNLAPLHKYYSLRKKALKVPELRHYDVYVPLVGEVRSRHTFDEAIDLVCEALAPLGQEYVGTMRAGLKGRWCDRYENKGKTSGAFSAGSFFGEPYILMNYKEDVIRDVFTLAHEAGHSMHSWYSAKSNPFMHYSYTIFEAEVASTFNEELLFDYLYKRAESDEMRAYLVNSRIDDMLATLYRQTMFAEFELKSHEMLEKGEPLTVDSLRTMYGALQRKYFGPEMAFEPESDLECLRIPHFYNAFYVYKYSTGISAAIALSRRVLSGGAAERDQYITFLKSGGSRFPIESLKLAGVDMSAPSPVKAACDEFAKLVGEFEKVIK